VREREEGILKINQDLTLINEMYKDLAHAVQTQQADIDDIAQATTESHARAAQGLDQLQKAAAYQVTCTIS
jgi:t-SNARE complex subunit (syntaxin)